MRKELSDAGFDAGAATIHFHLAQRHARRPSVPTIWRVLRARGFVTPQPKKRPKKLLHRFEADLPNECWQADMTHVTLANGSVFEVLNIIDDHSRLCVASRVMNVVKAHDVVRVLHKAAETWGYPASLLTDNGLIFTARPASASRAVVEQELFALGITAKHSRPYHPQTCGKVERFHQTLKKFVAAQEGIETKKQLQGHRPLRRLLQRGPTPSKPRSSDPSLGLSRPERRPSRPTPMVKTNGERLRLDKVDSAGLGDAAPSGTAPPHRHRSCLCRLAGRHAHRRPRHRGRRPRRLTPAAPRPRPDQGLPTHALSESPGLRCLDTSVSDVSRHHNGGEGEI